MRKVTLTPTPHHLTISNFQSPTCKSTFSVSPANKQSPGPSGAFSSMPQQSHRSKPTLVSPTGPRWCISAVWSLILLARDGPASYLHSQLNLCFSTVLPEDSSFSEIAPSSSSLQLKLFPWHVRAPPDTWQKKYLHMGEHLGGCLHLIISTTPKSQCF